tara:strand:- start:512 stop:658 length:147 start_codon:yes stop_codon:yes gene_type:complete
MLSLAVTAYTANKKPNKDHSVRKSKLFYTSILNSLIIAPEERLELPTW